MNKIVTSLALVFLVLLSGCISQETTYSPEGEKSAPTEKLKILDHKMEIGEFGSIYVTGTAENIAGKQLKYAEVKVKFYDKNNTLLDTFLDNVNDLNAGEKWSFKVAYPSMETEKVDHYEIAVGTVW